VQVAYVADLQDMCEELQSMQATMTEQATESGQQVCPLMRVHTLHEELLAPYAHFEALHFPALCCTGHTASADLCASCATCLRLPLRVRCRGTQAKALQEQLSVSLAVVERLEQAAVEAKSESAARRAELEAALEEAQASAGARSAARTQCTLL
jgi:hypothetical protein